MAEPAKKFHRDTTTYIAVPPRRQSLKGPGGGDTFDGMESASREYVDLKLEAAMTRIDGKFDLLNQRMASLEARVPTWWAILGAVFIGVGTLLAALSYAADRFDGGVSISTQQLEQLERDKAQDQKLDAVLSRLDALVSQQSTQPAPAPGTPNE